MSRHTPVLFAMPSKVTFREYCCLRDTMQVVSFCVLMPCDDSFFSRGCLTMAFLRPKTTLKELTKSNDRYENLWLHRRSNT